MQKRNRIILLCTIAAILCGLWLALGYAKARFSKEATKTLTELTGAEVKMRAADFKLNGTVRIDDIVIRPSRPCTFDDAIFKAKHVRATFGLLSLLKGQPRLKRVAVDDFVVNAQYDVNQARWNTQALHSLRTVGLSNKIPELRLKRGIINYSKVWGGIVSDIITMPVDATFKAVDKEADTLLVTIRGADTAADAPALKGTWRTEPSGKLALVGNLSNAKVPLFGNVWDLNDIFISVNYDANKINIDQFRMRLGDETTLSAKGSIDDYKRRGIFKIGASIKNLNHGREPIPNTFVYSNGLLENLPGTLIAKFFEEYKPSGVVDVDVNATGAFNEPAKTTCRGKLLCKNVSVTYKDFPYEMQDIRGTIDFTDRMVVLNKLEARHEDTKLEIDGYSRDFLPVWDCNISIISPKMALDNDLYNALDADQKRAWVVISPQGNIGMKYRFVREPNGVRHMQVVARLQDVDATYKRFQFPLKNLTGTMIIEPDRAVFDNVVSQYEGRKILINGWTKIKGQRWSNEQDSNDTDSYCLFLDAAGLELEKDVAPLLPPRAMQIFVPLKAQGKVRVKAQLSNNIDENCSEKTLIIDCLGDSISSAGLTYPIRDIRGRLILSNDEIKFEDVAAKVLNDPKTGEAGITLAGKAKFSETGLKEGDFKFEASDFALDDRISSLLDKTGQDIYRRLKPQGRADINLDSLRIVKDGNDVNSVNVTGGIAFKHCGFSSALPVSALDGKLNIKASYKPNGGLKSAASIDINSVKVKEKLLRKLFADVIYDDSAKMLEIRNISAEFYGGKLIGNWSLSDTNENKPGFTLNAMCDSINLKDFLASDSINEPPDYIHGLMSGVLDVNSQSGLKSGRLQLNITDMQVAKTSFFGKLLMILKLTEPKDYTFDNMTVMAYLRNNELIIEQMDLGGNAFILRGEGKIDLEKKTLDLNFIAGGPRFESQPSMFKSLTEGLWPAIVSLKITGDFTNPQIENSPMPVLKETLEVLGMQKCEEQN